MSNLAVLGMVSIYHKSTQCQVVLLFKDVPLYDEEEIWDIGLRYVAEVSGRKLRARGDLLVLDVLAVKLNVKLEKETHPLHANVSGWPPHKGQRILIAKKLEGKARLVVKPPDKSNL